MMTPVALITGCERRAERAAEPRRGRRFDPADDGALVRDRRVAAGDRAAHAAAASRSASTVASAPNRASSARTAARCRSCSIDGIKLKSGIASRWQDCSDCRIRAALQSAIRQCSMQFCNTMLHHLHEPRIRPSTVRSSASGRTPICRSSRPTRSWRRSIPICTKRSSARSRGRSRSRWCFPALDVPRLRARARARARVGRVPRDRRRRRRAGIARGSGRATRRSCAICSRSSARSDATEVLIDDRPVPYARELWLPLVWFLIPR